MADLNGPLKIATKACPAAVFPARAGHVRVLFALVDYSLTSRQSMAQAGGSSGSISDSLYSILTSLSFIGEQRFPCTSRLSAAVLSSQDIFEGRHIREAEDGESALFVTVPSQQAARRTDGGSAEGGEDDNDAERMSRLRRSTILGRSTRGQQENKTWALAKRRAPQRIAGPAQATPLRKRPAQQRRRMSRSEDGSKDPEAYLLAAKKLLTQ